MSDDIQDQNTPDTGDREATDAVAVIVTELPEPTWEEIEAWLEENTWV